MFVGNVKNSRTYRSQRPVCSCVNKVPSSLINWARIRTSLGVTEIFLDSSGQGRCDFSNSERNSCSFFSSSGRIPSMTMFFGAWAKSLDFKWADDSFEIYLTVWSSFFAFKAVISVGLGHLCLVRKVVTRPDSRLAPSCQSAFGPSGAFPKGLGQFESTWAPFSSVIRTWQKLNQTKKEGQFLPWHFSWPMAKVRSY